MGVHGLWRLIEPSGKPVPLETLENKVLAVDVSIWLHQAIKGFQDSRGAPVPNAHLLGIYHRVCKLLYFKIKPIFIFDGGVPVLKKQTIAKRNQSKSRNESEAEKLQKQLISTLLKHTAVSKVLSEKTKASLTLPTKKTSKHENMYALPSPEHNSSFSSSDDDLDNATDTTDSSPTKQWDVHSVDMSSSHFKSLPVNIRHEMLTELKETRKQSSWGRLHELPKQSDDFALYQMKRLLKRQSVQSALEEAEKEMGGHSLSLAELESILKDHGVATTNDIGKRIASDENTRYLYIKDVKQALEKARKEEEKLQSIQEENSLESVILPDTKNKTKADIEFEEDLEKAVVLSLQEKTTTEIATANNSESSNKCENILSDAKPKTKADLEFEKDLERAVILSLQEKPSTSKIETPSTSKNSNNFQVSFVDNFNDADFDCDVSDEIEKMPIKKVISSAQDYMLEYSGLTPNEINKILNKGTSATFKGGEVKKIQTKNLVEKGIETISHANNNHSCQDRAKEVVVSSNYQKNVEGDNTNVQINKIDSNTCMSESKRVTGDTCDSDSDSFDEFVEVSEEKKETNLLEIIINPGENLEDDLFSDIFNKNKEEEEKDIPLIIDQKNKLDGSIGDTVDHEKINEVKNTDKTSEMALKMNEVSHVSTSVQNSSKNIAESENESKKELIHKNQEINSPKEVTNITSDTKKINVEQMVDLRNELQKEKIDIMVEKSIKERMASNITDQMYQEAQDLLQLFGVPYIIAPMEAEAQCAFLDIIELTDGTITDDSDIWLFGGHTVYKNFFNQSKYVMEFKADNIKHHFKLTREQMILLALLVGSDYTVGLQGIGPVTALEILAAFPSTESKEFSVSHPELLSGLKEFRSWFNKGKSAGPGRSSLKNKLKNLSFTDNFPSLQVVQAYMDPTVETSKEKFSWSKPDFVGLTEFAKEKFGWSPKKTEEILKPIIKKVEENQAQKTMKDYFKSVYKADSTNTQNQMSKRVKSAINRIGKTPEELIAEEMAMLAKEKQKRPKARKKIEDQIENESNLPSKEIKRENKPRKSRKKGSESVGTNSKYFSNADKNDGESLSELQEPKQKKSKSKSNKGSKKTETVIAPAQSSENTNTQIDENEDDLKKYENIAVELKRRRQRRNELAKQENPSTPVKKKKLPPQKTISEDIPHVLENDEEIQILKATTSASLKKVEDINQEIENEFVSLNKKTCLPNVHKREVIHQKLRDKSDLLRNKMKAIEIFRKSKKGPGYIPKRGKKKVLLKEDAELSENSSDE